MNDGDEPSRRGYHIDAYDLTEPNGFASVPISLTEGERALIEEIFERNFVFGRDKFLHLSSI